MNFNSLLDSFHLLLPRLTTAFPIAIVVILGGLLLNLIVSRSLTLLTHRTSLTPADVLPVRKIVRWLIGVVIFILLLSVFGFQLSGLWAMLSTVLAMIAIGFVAVWSMLSNVSATALILLMRPFNIGDEIELQSEKIKGRVIDLNFFFTTLQIDEHTTHQVPNNLFFQKVITRINHGSKASLGEQLHKEQPAILPTSSHSSESSVKSPVN